MDALHEILFTKKQLRFNGNGKFRILIFSDFHAVLDFDRRLIRDVGAIVEGCKPDLVILNGDQIWKDEFKTPEQLHGFLSEINDEFEKRNVPWAHTFGNHDAESGFEVCDQQDVYESFDYCISKRGDSNIHGTGNYVLPVLSSKGDHIAYNIWALDSHRNTVQFVEEGKEEYDEWRIFVKDPIYPCQKYDSIRFDQLMWYWNTSVLLEEYNKSIIPGIMVFHAPIPEFIQLYKNVAETNYRGNRREGVGCGPLNTGVFATVFQRGDVKTIVCGHDHINDFQGKYLGITMAMDGGLNYDCYCDDDLRGGRIVDIDENDVWNVKTYMIRSCEFVTDYPGKKV